LLAINKTICSGKLWVISLGILNFQSYSARLKALPYVSLPTPLLLYRIQISGKVGDDTKHYQIKAVKAVIEESRR